MTNIDKITNVLVDFITYVDDPKVPDPALISKLIEFAVCCCI